MIIHCKYDKLIDLGVLKSHPKNRNKHSKKQVERLAKLYEFHGLRHPIIVSNLSGYIVAGHGRLAAAKKLKLKDFPVVYQNFDSNSAEYAFLQADNAIALWAELDLDAIKLDLPELGEGFDLDLLGVKNLETGKEYDAKCDEDEVPEHVEPKTKLDDIYTLGDHRLMCGDSTSIDAVDKLMNGEKSDMVFTDPPYGISHKGNIGIPGSGWSGDGRKNTYKPIENDHSTQTAKDCFKLCSSLSDNLIFWGANYYCDALPEMHSWLVWDKKTVGDNYSACELAYTSSVGRIKKFEHQWHGMIKGSEMGQARVHPTQKPIALAEWCFENYGNSKSVLDLFGGSGSTLIACEKTNRKCFMIELDPHYCDVIVARWEKYTGKKAQLISDKAANG